MKNLPVDYYANNFTATALEQLLYMSTHEMEDAEVQREVPKIKEALHVLQVFENLEKNDSPG